MDGMAQTPAHARPARRDHLWVLAIIAICALFEVWVSWVTIGSMSGFPKIGGEHGLPTAWTLAVTSEAYWGYALYAWLAGAPGPRSRRFAMCSFAVVFVLSLIGQGASHLVPAGTVPPPEVVVFITSLPVIVLALIAVLVHLRQLDRVDAAEAAADASAVAEIAVLRAGLEAQREALAAAQAERDAAQREAAAVAAKAEVMERKLAAAAAASRTRKTAQKKAPAVPATKVPRDVDVQAEALAVLAAEPDITGKDLGERVGRSERWGQDFKKNLAGSAADPEGRSGERS